MNIMIDEYGRPILLLADQDRKKRVKGLEAYKVFIKINLVKYSCCQISRFFTKNLSWTERNG